MMAIWEYFAFLFSLVMLIYVALQIVTGCGKAEKFERTTGFDITVASEIMVRLTFELSVTL